MTELFPPIEPYKTHYLKVSPRHTLYIEECGNPNGKPIVFLHGGPGGGINLLSRQYFNPDKYRIILFDQRGCGKSTPFAELTENTTWDLVDDIEKIRELLGIQKWVVFGGSWGSTLALAYSEKYPEQCKGLILRGIFLVTQSEIQWFYQNGAHAIFPDAWEPYLNHIPENERHDMISAYYKRLTSPDQEIRLKAAQAWSVWEGRTSKLLVDFNDTKRFSEDHFAEAFARIECHYFMNKGFFKTDDYLIRHISAIRKIPAVIIQGRYDIVCPITTAWSLHKAWPEADFHIIPDAGHSMSEPGIRDKLITYTEKFSQL